MRSPVDRALEAQIAKAAVTALGDHQLLTGLQQLVEHLAGLGVANQRAHRHLERDVVAHGAEHVRAHAVLAALGLVAARIAVIDQGVEARVGHGVHMAAPATVAAVGAAKLFVLLMTERDAAVPAVAGGNVDVGFVNELHGGSSLSEG